MRQIFLDTETTGLEVRLGHRLIEVACVEMINRRLTQRNLHYYINPDHDIDEGAMKVHGITREFLEDKPRFSDIAQELLNFIRDAELVIHNASFDLGFLNTELKILGLGPISSVCPDVRDTLKMARELHPGKKNNLNALCERYGVNNAHRTLHGALLDAEILADVYVAMTRGQESLIIDQRSPQTEKVQLAANLERRPTPVIHPTDEELAAHDKVLAAIQKESKGKCIWLAES